MANNIFVKRIGKKDERHLGFNHQYEQITTNSKVSAKIVPTKGKMRGSPQDIYRQGDSLT